MTSKREESLDLTSPNAVNYTIPDLISHLQHTFLPGDFNRVIDILSAKEEKTKNDYTLLQEQHADLQLSNLQMEDELKASKKVNVELRERLLRAKDEIVVLWRDMKGLERGKSAAEELLNLYKSRFDMLMMRVNKIEDDARVLMFERARDEEEEERRGTNSSSNSSLMHDRIGETQGQVIEEMACVSNKTKKDDPSTSTTDPAMPVQTEPKIEPEAEVVDKIQQGSETIIVKNEMVSPSASGLKRKAVIVDIIDSDDEQPMVSPSASVLKRKAVIVEIIDTDDEQPMVVMPSASGLKRKGVSPFGGVNEGCSRSFSQMAGGDIKLPQDLNVQRKKLCGSQSRTVPTTSHGNDVAASGTSSNQKPGVLRSCEDKIRSKLTSDQLMSEINKFASEDTSSDESENDYVDWKNKEDTSQPMVVVPSASGLKRKGVSPFGGVNEGGSRSFSQMAGGDIKLPQDLNVQRKKLCGSQSRTVPTTSHGNDVAASGTSSNQKSGVLRTCEDKIRSKLTSDQLMSEINKFASEDSSSDESENDYVDWKNKEDMIMTLEKDPELCMKAICALYRERSFNRLEFHNTQIDEKSTALRGTALAEYLINRDPQAKLKRSALELWQKDEKGLHDCQRIAKVYAKKLFEIYKKGRDTNAFLPPFF